MKDLTDERDSQVRECKRVEFDAIAEQLGLAGSGDESNRQIEMIHDELRFKFAGFGGQGILSLGMMMAQMSMERNMEVTWLPSYGPEMRGGVANCSVVVSKGPVGSPAVDVPNVLVALNRPSLDKFGPLVEGDGMVIYNSSLIDQVPEGLKARVFALPATDLASEAGSVKAANVVVLGFVARKTGLFDLAELETFLAETFKKPALLDINLKLSRPDGTGRSSWPARQIGTQDE